MKVNPIVLSVLAAAAVIALAVVATRGGQTSADDAGTLGFEWNNPSDGVLSPYLVGYYRCEEFDGTGGVGAQYFSDNCDGINTVFRFVNPTSEYLEKDVALFDWDENLIGCYLGHLTQNQLELDNLGWMLEQGLIYKPNTWPNPEPVTELPLNGVVKVVVEDPTSPNAIEQLRSGLVGWAEYAPGLDSGPFGSSSLGPVVALANIPREVLLEDVNSGPNQDIPGSDGRPDELAKIYDQCFPGEPSPTPTITATPTDTATPTNTPTPTTPTITPTPTKTPTPFVPQSTATPTSTATSSTPPTATPWCFEIPGGLFCIPGGFISD